MKTFLIRGVPMAMQQDGWWMQDEPKPAPTERHRTPARPLPWRLALLAVLIALGDVLVWRVTPGVSLAVFVGLLLVTAMGLLWDRRTPRQLALVGGGGVMTVLPLVELVQPLSIVIAAVGMTLLLVVLAGVRTGFLRAALRLWPFGTAQSVSDTTMAISATDGQGTKAAALRLARHWVMPLGLGGLFALLLLVANPVADRWIADFEMELPALSRILFWLALVPVIWTALNLAVIRERLRAPGRAARQGPLREGLINAGSVTRALVLFNAGFAVQTVMDAAYLYGGLGLPDGITYAQYAHRGAYPLVLTALLAGLFALVTRRWTQTSPLLRGLMLMWIAQNIALVVSSLVRLDLYVQIYGLTHLRLAAAIWMGIVACGLGLVLVQVWRGLPNRWMLTRTTVVGFGVLYVCAFVSFDAAVARHNLSKDTLRDRVYICTLGEAAAPLIKAAEAARGITLCKYPRKVRSPQDWREWGFRNWRTRNSLAAPQPQAATDVP